MKKQKELTWNDIKAINAETSKMLREDRKQSKEYFINSFKENPTFLGEKFDRVMPNLYPDPMVMNDEYDLVLRNGTTTALSENIRAW
jgi:hypothetical protein